VESDHPGCVLSQDREEEKPEERPESPTPKRKSTMADVHKRKTIIAQVGWLLYEGFSD